MRDASEIERAFAEFSRKTQRRLIVLPIAFFNQSIATDRRAGRPP